MFRFITSEKKLVESKEFEMKSMNTEDYLNIKEKLNKLRALTPDEYNRKFNFAHENYMHHRSSNISIKSTLFGFGCAEENQRYMRPYRYYLAQRMIAKKLYDTNKELLLLLNEAGVGKDKKSLNFHVLVQLFELEYEKYDDKSAHQLIEETLKILRINFPDIKPATGPRMAIRY